MLYKEIWQSLETAPSIETLYGYIMRRVKPEARCDLFLAVIKPSNEHVLHIGFASDSDLPLDRLPSVRGLGITPLRSYDTQHGLTLQLSLREQRFHTLFDILIEDIIETVSRAGTEKAAATSLISRLQQWQKFFEQVGPSGLSREAQQGLYGELWFLREQLLSVVDEHRAIAGWTGPRGAHQDFQYPSCAIEVKTTGTKEPQQLIIQSERQLDTTGLKALFLFHLSLEAREGSGESLTTLIESLRELLQNNIAANELYEDRLFEAGFLQSQASNYQKTGYIVRSTSLFHVRDAFPRIVVADLKPGIGAVRYSIAVSECRHFIVDEHILKSQLRG